MEILSHGAAETEALGMRLATRLRPGAVVALSGDLGAGKTVFARGVARGLGISAQVVSPTFTIVNEYEGGIPFFHFDLYRLGGAEELLEIGWDDYLCRGGVCVVEWSERAPEMFDDCARVTILRGGGRDERRILFEGVDPFADPCD